MTDIKETIGKNIRILRKQRGQSLQSLAKQIGISHQQLSNIEHGSGTSSITLERIAAILDIELKALVDEPEVTLHNSIPRTKNFVPEQLCNEFYSKLFADVVKVTNDVVIDKFMEEIIEKLVKDKNIVRNLMCSHVGKQESYEFTPSELMEYSQQLFVDFADYAMRLSKNELESEED